MPPMPRLIELAPLVVWLLGASACTYFQGDPHVLVTSTPAGAEILVDGEPTGLTTPVKLDLGGILGSDHTITLRKLGHEEEHRRVYHYTTTYTSKWVDGVTEYALPSSPIDWTFGDFFTPFAVRWRYVPHEIHAVLHPAGQAPKRSPMGVAAAPPDDAR